MCEVCWVTLQLGHRAVCFSCGQECHMLHARCVVEGPAKGAAPAPFRFLAVNRGTQHQIRDVLDAQRSKRTRVFVIKPRRWEGGIAGDEDLHTRGIGTYGARTTWV